MHLNFKLYFCGKDLKRNHNFKFCWSSYCTIYVRKSEYSPDILLINEKHIEQLKGSKGIVYLLYLLFFWFVTIYQMNTKHTLTIQAQSRNIPSGNFLSYTNHNLAHL